jgi:hypothetical protein
MPAYTESLAYARERLERLENRYRYYSANYYITRAANSSSRRMTNLNKLRSWETVLREAGYDSAANFAQNRRENLESGAIVAPTRRRLGRTQVTRYEPIPQHALNPLGPSFVEYEFEVGGEDV